MHHGHLMGLMYSQMVGTMHYKAALATLVTYLAVLCYGENKQRAKDI